MDKIDIIVLRRVREILIGFTEGVIHNYQLGVCGNIEQIIGESLYEVWDKFYAPVMTEWCYYSGSPIYPVPLPDWCSSKVHNLTGWYSALSKWDRVTDYGINRFMFVNYLIGQIDLKLKLS